MPKFRYVARDIDGTPYKGTIVANDKKEVRANLRQKGFYVTSIHAVHEWNQIKLFNNITNDEVAVFAEQLSVMVEAGLTLPRCLTTLAQQSKNPKFKEVINKIKQDVENGDSFADALAKHPKVFNSLFVNLVKAGEIGGVLSRSLRQISDYLDNERALKHKVKSAITYPKIVAGMSVLVVIFVITFLVPRFMVLYNSIGIQLPLPTRILISISNFFSKYWWALLIGTGTIVFVYKRFKSSKFGKGIIDQIKVYMPVFGELNRKVIVAKFIKVLSALTGSGVPMMQALEVAGQVANNKVMDDVIESVRNNVSEGGGLKEPMQESDIFPPMVVQMVSVGEEVGNLEGSLDKGASYLDREIDTAVKKLIAKIEPATTVAIAVVVGLILMAIYLPMFDVVKIAKR